MTTQINQLTELTSTSDGDLLLIREASTGVDKKMQAVNLRAKATTKDDVGLGNVPNLDTTNAVAGNFASVNIDGGNIDGTAIGASSASSGAFTTLTASDDVNFDSGTLFVDASTNRVGIGTIAPFTQLDVFQANAKSATGAWQMLSFDTTSQTTGVGGGITFGGYKTTQTAAEFFAGIDGYKENSTAGNAAGALRFHTQVAGGTGLVERMRIDSSGNVGITNGNLKFNTNGTGIDFSAVQGAGASSSILDDYEEGTWTPTINLGWSSVSYITQDGKYTKIGNQVTAFFALRFSGTSVAERIQITGLPFTVAGSHGGALTYYDAPTNETTGILIYPTSTSIDFYADNDSGATVQSNGNASSDFLIGSVTYLV